MRRSYVRKSEFFRTSDIFAVYFNSFAPAVFFPYRLKFYYIVEITAQYFTAIYAFVPHGYEKTVGKKVVDSGNAHSTFLAQHIQHLEERQVIGNMHVVQVFYDFLGPAQRVPARIRTQQTVIVVQRSVHPFVVRIRNERRIDIGYEFCLGYIARHLQLIEHEYDAYQSPAQRGYFDHQFTIEQKQQDRQYSRYKYRQ